MNTSLQTVETASDVVIDCRDALSVTGKSRTDKALSVIRSGITTNTRMFAAAQKGKAATEARQGLGDDSMARAALEAARGNYTQFYELIVFLSVKCVQPIRSGADYERARGFIGGLRDNLKDAGYNKSGKLTTEAKGYDACLMLFRAADAAIEARKVEDANRRAQRAIENAKQDEHADA